jgi:hypothetical protein
VIFFSVYIGFGLAGGKQVLEKILQRSPDSGLECGQLREKRD